MPCPKCEGRGWIHYGNGGGMTCSACGATGKSYAERKALREKNNGIRNKKYQEIKDKIEELSTAIEAFQIKTNLDAVVLEAAKEELKRLRFEIYSYLSRKMKQIKISKTGNTQSYSGPDKNVTQIQISGNAIIAGIIGFCILILSIVSWF